ncbi:hypothetical protein CPB83DRAFT_584693 [Crepidotus variabilis]|uniref:Secreted protein n=1 Tax=Crepidotus variabilis TaxID=179855 RepID=A0A9P6EPM4_9AGAR|nr:hypothetical protein CPB83DRAFT_584693 [Crepidotus variabilis]
MLGMLVIRLTPIAFSFCICHGYFFGSHGDIIFEKIAFFFYFQPDFKPTSFASKSYEARVSSANSRQEKEHRTSKTNGRPRKLRLRDHNWQWYKNPLRKTGRKDLQT